MFKYKYDFENLSKKDVMYLGASNNLVSFFVWTTGLIFSLYGFQIGFSALNYMWGIPYYFYIASMLGTIASFVFKHVEYIKHQYFGNSRKYIVDTSVYLLFLLAFFLNAFYRTTAVPVVDNFVSINWDFRILIPVLIPPSIIFWVYLYGLFSP